MVGALFPAVGDSIGKLDLPKGVADLLGGADYGTITGWMRSEIGAVYGPLVIARHRRSPAPSRSTAGEEEERILGLVLAHPIRVPAGPREGGGGRRRRCRRRPRDVRADRRRRGRRRRDPVGHRRARAPPGVLRLGDRRARARARRRHRPPGGRRGGAAGFAVLGFLINGFAPLVDGIHWLKYLSPFYYYAGHDPLASGVDVGDLAVLVAASLVLTALAVAGFRRRDLRA